ncbi:hypothetical protein B4U13_05640 [Klebsiella pneumoniae]|nr:hypothetical protein B4U13_05640 [Klebsiella pneumoniae]
MAAGALPGLRFAQPVVNLFTSLAETAGVLWTCRPSAHTYGQMLPTLDRTQDFTETAHGDR